MSLKEIPTASPSKILIAETSVAKKIKVNSQLFSFLLEKFVRLKLSVAFARLRSSGDSTAANTTIIEKKAIGKRWNGRCGIRKVPRKAMPVLTKMSLLRFASGWIRNCDYNLKRCAFMAWMRDHLETFHARKLESITKIYENKVVEGRRRLAESTRQSRKSATSEASVKGEFDNMVTSLKETRQSLIRQQEVNKILKLRITTLSRRDPHIVAEPQQTVKKTRERRSGSTTSSSSASSSSSAAAVTAERVEEYLQHIQQCHRNILHHKKLLAEVESRCKELDLRNKDLQSQREELLVASEAMIQEEREKRLDIECLLSQLRQGNAP